LILSTLLGFEIENLKSVKIHFATGSNDRREPLNQFFSGKFKEWQERQNQKNFEREYILSLAYKDKNEWLFLGIYKRISVTESNNGFSYATELTDFGDEWIGRLVIEYNKEYRNSYILAEKYFNDFKIKEILPERLQLEDFPGYENVNIDRMKLQLIITQEIKTWKTALKCVTGVYLIADGNNGKLYVGSATGEENFWKRWSEYAQSFHGNNIQLKKLHKENEEEYFKNIHYSILEIHKANTDAELILQREMYWKQILMTKEFGYNLN